MDVVDIDEEVISISDSEEDVDSLNSSFEGTSALNSHSRSSTTIEPAIDLTGDSPTAPGRRLSQTSASFPPSMPSTGLNLYDSDSSLSPQLPPSVKSKKRPPSSFNSDTNPVCTAGQYDDIEYDTEMRLTPNMLLSQQAPKRIKEKEGVRECLSQPAATINQQGLERKVAKKGRMALKSLEKAGYISDKLKLQISQGKFANREIGVEFESRLANSPPGFEFAEMLANAVCRGIDSQFSVLDPFEYENRGVIRWRWRSYLCGGIKDCTNSSLYPLEPIPCIALYWSGVEFIQAVLRKEHKQIEQLIRNLRASVYNPKARFFFIVEGINSGLVKIAHGKKGAERCRNSTRAEVFDMVSYLYSSLSCSTKFTIDLKDSTEYLVALTRELSQVPYREKDQMLDFIPRLNSFRVRPDGTNLPYTDTWLHFLQMISGVSEAKAQKILDHFPNVYSLMEVYLNPSLNVKEKETLLQDKMGTGRFELAVSRRIYLVLTSLNEELIVD